MKIFIGMETSGMLRRRFQAKHHFVISCDLLPSEDGGEDCKQGGGHVVGDVFTVFNNLRDCGVHFDMGIFHPTCTYLTHSAEWAFKDPDYVRYPGVGYHQKVKPDTLVGAARRAARIRALADVNRILNLPLGSLCIENPIGAIQQIRPFTQIIQPYEFGDNASKATGLILVNLPMLKPTGYYPPRIVKQNGKELWRWGNQTDSGQNKLSPGKDRWKERSRTFPGIADAMADQWG